jgi:hypothetical protein
MDKKLTQTLKETKVSREDSIYFNTIITPLYISNSVLIICCLILTVTYHFIWAIIFFIVAVYKAIKLNERAKELKMEMIDDRFDIIDKQKAKREGGKK